ncbi:MAG: LytTR family DNA-binding domain-containing protein [Ferruginibacter sp.]
MITAIIIDDEAKGRLALKEKLKSYCPDVELLAEASGGEQGMAAIETFKPQVVFLDIEMPGMSGFEMLQQLPTHDFHLIFTTAYDQYAIKAIKYAAFDYLLKPIDISELQQAVKKISSARVTQLQKQLELLKDNTGQVKKPFHKIAIPTLEGLLFYNIDDIICLEANSNYSNLHFSNRQKIVASKTLKEFEEMLPADIFFRPHHSWLINLSFVKRYIRGDGGQVEMQNGMYIEVSRRKKEAFLQLMR